MAASILFLGASHLLAPLLILLLVFVNKCQCSEEPVLYDAEDPVADFILCRKCGADVVDAGFIVNKLSPEAIVLNNQTLFDRQSVAVQLLTNPLGIRFSTIALSTASCFGASETWSIKFTWYPGYAWKSCFCRHCGHLLGWMFEPIKTATKDRLLPTNDGFYLLILDSLLSEKCCRGFSHSRSQVVQELAKVKMGDLTEEQREFLEQCEEEFTNRYTDEDKDFMKLKSAEPKKPPIVDPWYNKPRRPLYDWSRQNRGHGGRRNHSDRRNNDRNERYDRHGSSRQDFYQRNSRLY